MAQHPAGGSEVADGPGPQQTSPGPAGLRRWCGPPVAVRAVLLGEPEQGRAAEAASRDERGPGEREQPPPVRTPARLTVVRDGVLRRDHGTGPGRDGVRRGARGVGGGGYGVGRSGPGVRCARRGARAARVRRAGRGARVARVGRGARTVQAGSGVRHQRRDPVLVVADQAGHRIPLPPRAAGERSAHQLSTSATVGRCAGSPVRQEARNTRHSSVGAPSRSASPRTVRYSTWCAGPEPKGARPVANRASSAARANTSVAGEGSASAVSSSGAMNPGEPMTSPVSVRVSSAARRAMPKSRTFGPPRVSTTFDGFRSRWTSPAR